ncbi:ATP-dependent protease La Type I [Methylophaga frappieri]|uniref:Lon protease n=1 Tax=Methylophaga frappieri (strain ATCC BAA-2434 / DSM 25690 / JAM7) TaxID=754477 RepID=I1YLK0_METFJ|nr:endopeptidase La [Methylophaga frappieri]AFJ03793.1 ATP-dependent protease La Type I [Methylophaga frappieri]
MENKTTTVTEDTLEKLPVLPLRDVVVYPHMVIPLFVGREKSIKALEVATDENQPILLVAQKDSGEDAPSADNLYDTGTVANILQLLKLPDGTVKVLVEGTQRAQVTRIDDSQEYFEADIVMLSDALPEEREADVLMRTLLTQFEQYVKLNKKIPPEVIASLSGIEESARMADTVAAHMTLKLEDKQQLLEMADVKERIEKLMAYLESEIDIQQIEKRIRNRVKKQMEKSQREYYLNEQLKAVQKELGELDETANENDELAEKIAEAGMPKAAREKAESELKKLKMMSPMSAEATVVRNYIESLLEVPWKKRSKVTLDLDRAQTILDEDHFGLEKVKERIVEYLAVQKRVKKIKGPILCLVGPPGVGKTSIAQSIARATNRKFTRMALGGVRDEAEIRGHRRTYIGSMPGKVMQNIAKTEVKNPLFLLDEIDKMAMDFRGDPASALLEVLDPEQNSTFADHYLEVEYDLSDVMFVCTANTLNIPDALRDRMEIIRLAGYTEDEKLNIALQYLLPKALKDTGLKPSEVDITSQAVMEIIRRYTREAGVRSLQREIAKVCRKVLKQILKTSDSDKIVVTADNLEDYLGVYHYQYGVAEESDRIGQVTGLAWTEVGGELLTIESAVMPGKGKASYTGKLGDVMQESIQAATTVVRSRAAEWGVADDFIQNHDLHIHVPEGATPKDGPSAGIGMCTALLSAITGIPVKANVAMTGEITLRGEVLAIGGLKEKLLAAHRGGIDTVLIPKDNVKDLREIPDNVKKGLKIIPVRWIQEVLEVALQQLPEPRNTSEPSPAVMSGEKPGFHEVNTQNRH